MKRHELETWLLDDARPPLVMGVLNVTPDSFSDGGQFVSVEAAVTHALALADQGADWIDVGGESTRPGSSPVPQDEQIRRTAPVIEGIAKRLDIVISIDTSRSIVAQAALDAGATMVNDIFASRDDPQMLPLLARQAVPVVLMHMQGMPATMQAAPSYQDVAAEVIEFLRDRAGAAMSAGVEAHRILLDPGIGFGKTRSHNLEILRKLSEIAALGRPVVVAVSRKAFIGSITGEPAPSRRIFGSAAAVAWSVANRAAVVRVHDVREMTQVVKMVRAIQSG